MPDWEFPFVSLILHFLISKNPLTSKQKNLTIHLARSKSRKTPDQHFKPLYILEPTNLISRCSKKVVADHTIKWDTLFKNRPSKICGGQPLKNFTWSILEYFAPNVTLSPRRQRSLNHGLLKAFSFRIDSSSFKKQWTDFSTHQYKQSFT